MAKFNSQDEGKRIVLLANEAEGWPREEGTLLGVENKGMLIVEVDDEFLDDDFDDGIREIHEDGVELL